MPYILAYGSPGDSDVQVGPSILAYGWRACRVQDSHNFFHFGVWGGMEVVMF
jgi:hypothetical protein